MDTVEFVDWLAFFELSAEERQTAVDMARQEAAAWAGRGF